VPAWAGKWKGGRYYLDDEGRKVFFIERRKRSVKLTTHDEDLAIGQLATFLQDPDAFTRPAPAPAGPDAPVHITTGRLNLYGQHIRKACLDHRNARKSYLLKWADYRDDQGKPLDLRTADKKTLRAALASFDGGFGGRVEALNAFARFLVKERDQGLPSWAPLVNPYDAKPTRAERQAYSLEQLAEAYARVSSRFKDVLLLRVATGLHQTEIDQLEKCALVDGPLPDNEKKPRPAIRVLGGEHEVQGVIQVWHKSQHRHRVSVTKPVLEAALRLREGGVPYRVSVWKALDPLVPSNLRHTFETLAEDCGRWVTFSGEGVDRARVAQAMGHLAGSKMIDRRYNKSQVPPMIVLPLGFP
jgi:hypothetical protein